MPKRFASAALAFIITISLISCASTIENTRPLPIELRGIWISTTDSDVFRSRANIAAAMDFLAQHNFNVVFPSVWRQGATLYKSEVMKSTFGIEIDPKFAGRDPLAEFIEEAHKRNIAVIPWFEYGFVASHNQNGGTILQQKPRWAARDRNGKVLLEDGYEWMNALDPEVQEFMLSLVAEVVAKYDVDGVQGDHRLPAQPIEGGYDSVTTAAYKETHPGYDPPLDIHETHWKYWRAVRLNAFVQQFYWKVKALKPNVMVSWAPGVSPKSLNEMLQDWRSWISENVRGDYFADLVHPRVFERDINRYKRVLDSQHRDSLKIQQKNRYQYPALRLADDNYAISESDLKEAVRYNRYSGYNGEVFSSYEALRRDNDRLANALKESYYKTPARLPFTPEFMKKKAEITK
ncbi:MAG: family 10 glycosylhydrolase [Ignavibacteriae bacterium]|nr:family 10 glycosylhydrolase [Ignavibacteriota bacterium]